MPDIGSSVALDPKTKLIMERIRSLNDQIINLEVLLDNVSIQIAETLPYSGSIERKSLIERQKLLSKDINDYRRELRAYQKQLEKAQR